jgi:hypothetical protein
VALALGVPVHLDLDGRPRADERHLPAQHVDQVRQLVHRAAPKQRTYAGDAVVARVDDQPAPDRLRPAHHRSQLVELERLAIAAHAALAVDRVAVGLESHRQRRERHQRAGQHGEHAARHQVERALAAGEEVGVHRVPSGVSQPAGVPCRSQS